MSKCCAAHEEYDEGYCPFCHITKLKAQLDAVKNVKSFTLGDIEMFKFDTEGLAAIMITRWIPSVSIDAVLKEET